MDYEEGLSTPMRRESPSNRRDKSGELLSLPLLGSDNGKKPKPFLKWAGGKRQLLPEIQKYYPKHERYHEPFLGGGAVFFDLLPQQAILSDINQELIGVYQVIRDHAEELIEDLQQHRYEKNYYYRIRDKDPHSLTKIEAASRMIFLNRAGFNGLYRVNSKGKFNVPFGKHKNPRICNAENLRACSRALQGIEVRCTPFEAIVDVAAEGDFVYLDPPYYPLSDTANFTSYQSGGFDESCQDQLAQVFENLSDKGVKLMLSNSDVEWIRKRYSEIKNGRIRINTIQARRAVNSNGKRRGPVGELLITNY